MRIGSAVHGAAESSVSSFWSGGKCSDECWLFFEVTTGSLLHIMVRIHATADAIRIRAKKIRQTGCYCSIFEIAVLAHLRNVRVKVPFGTDCIDIYEHFKDDLPPQPQREKRPWWKFVAVFMLPGGP